MTSAQVPGPHPAHPGTHRQEGTPVADERFPHALPETSTDPVSTPIDNTDDGPTQRILRPGNDDLDTTTASTTGVTQPDPAVSVWTTAQTSPAAQRKGRYVAESTAHPAMMLPSVAAYAIAHYTEPGDLVLDPMCGIGTTWSNATSSASSAKRACRCT